ncbi:MAG: alpha/beta fold hydrolase [Myxococcales bacterium]|nr:alpha/beta fold hydrolase [Myxococcales bacterium]
MGAVDLQVREHFVTTCDGWSLSLRSTRSRHHFDPRTRPLLIVPGYGMNSFIFSFHPRGTSLERCLAEAGYEVWAMDLRGQGQSRRERRRAGHAGLDTYATIDLPAAAERVLAATQTTSKDLCLIGCSLGGTLACAYLAHAPNHRVGAFISMGAPLSWKEVHPMLKIAFRSPRIAGAFRLTGTRALVRAGFPILRHAPSLLGLYMNPATIDTSRMHEMAATVEDPEPRVNREIAEWIRARDLTIRGVNVTRAMSRMNLPLLVVVARQDGIVPEPTALTVAEAWGGPDVEILKVGTGDNWYAHANLFVADDAPHLVFEPIIRWLRRREM